jgi:hypothetical protein
VKTMIVALVKVGIAIKVGNAKTTSADVERSYFVGIFLRSFIKVCIYLFEF